MRWVWAIYCAASLTALGAAAPAKPPTKPAEALPSQAPALVWKRGTERFDAQLAKVPVLEVLASIRLQTGWEVFVDPDLQLEVTAQFKDRTAGEALDLLLGNASYALVPDKKTSAKLYIYRSNRDQATQRVQVKAAKPRTIPNELVVVLKPDKDGRALASQYNAKVVGEIAKPNAVRLRFEDEEAARKARELIEANGNWGEVDAVYIIERPTTPEQAGNAALPRLALEQGSSADGSSVIIGLVDSAVQFKGMARTDFLMPSVNLYEGELTASTTPGHGTSMADAIMRGLSDMKMAGTDLPVRILPVDIYGDRATTTSFDVARGITEAINGGATIVNLSLGSAGESKVMHSIIQQGNERGVLFLGAAGNTPVTTPNYPAAYPEVLAVTATDYTGGIASYANRGEFVDIGGPSTTRVQFNDRMYIVSGTSAATAYNSGVAAALVAKRTLTAQQAGARMRTVLRIAPSKP
ncbi:MAG: hypothetical protein EXS22_09575 [Pedosphaera sp.]|nr:hypothetical protein [Pedosphaera sp.]MSU44265.1 hypothetical protein [Pedosphaera sp.]